MPTAPSCIDNSWSEVAGSAARRVVHLWLLSIHNGAVGMMDLDIMRLWVRARVKFGLVSNCVFFIMIVSKKCYLAQGPFSI